MGQSSWDEYLAVVNHRHDTQVIMRPTVVYIASRGKFTLTKKKLKGVLNATCNRVECRCHELGIKAIHVPGFDWIGENADGYEFERRS